MSNLANRPAPSSAPEDDILLGTEADDTLEGGSGADTLSGGLGDDFLYGHLSPGSGLSADGDGADLLEGQQGNDLLRGNAGDDTLLGGSGYDNLRGDAGDDTIDGGSDIDLVSYRWDEFTDLGAGVVFDATAAGFGTQDVVTVVDEHGGTDTVMNIERLRLTGSAFGDQFKGATGDDVLDGRDGDDTLLGAGGQDQLWGGAGADSMVGGNGDDVLTGGAGNDRLQGGDGDYDRVSVHLDWMVDLVAGVAFDASALVLGVGDELSMVDEYGDTDTLTGIEQLMVYGSAFGDELKGSQSINTLLGQGGDDTLEGGAADDYIDGGTGADRMTGGAGYDIYVVDDAGDEVIELQDGEPNMVYATIDYTLPEQVSDLYLMEGAARQGTGNDAVNYIYGSSADNQLLGLGGADNLQGADGNDTLNGGRGADELLGGAGDDVFIVNQAGDRVEEYEDQGSDTIRASVSFSLPSFVQKLVLTGTADLEAYGNNGNNTLTGNSGRNDLEGGAGNDTLAGGDGMDRLWGGAGADVVVLNSRVGQDVVFDHVSGADRLRIAQGKLGVEVGNGDQVLDSWERAGSQGGFALTSELVLASGGLSGEPTITEMAARLGDADSAFEIGDSRIFVLDNGGDSYVLLFTSQDDGTSVEASELTLLATLLDSASFGSADLLLGA